jgi:hypothetical protein
MPPTDFHVFRYEILATYGPDLTCDTTPKHLCRWKGKSCLNVNLLHKQKGPHNIDLYLFDQDDNVQNFKLDFSTLLVDGDVLGLSKDDCYFAIQATESEDSTWYLGVSFLQEIMVVFDNTQEAGPRIGLGYANVGSALQTIEMNYEKDGMYTK